jgi:S1-C subfamily serine protease
MDLPVRSNGGSVEYGVREPERILPRGFNSVNSNRSANVNTDRVDTGVPVRNVLGILGVNAEFVGGECKVSAVAENSLGAGAGIKAGDVIETIDGRAVNGETRLKGNGPKSFVVRRDGKRVNLRIGR